MRILLIVAIAAALIPTAVFAGEPIPPSGEPVYLDPTGWPDVARDLGLVFIFVGTLLGTFTFGIVRPYLVGEAEYKKRCKKCPAEDKEEEDDSATLPI